MKPYSKQPSSKVSSYFKFPQTLENLPCDIITWLTINCYSISGSGSGSHFVVIQFSHFLFECSLRDWEKVHRVHLRHSERIAVCFGLRETLSFNWNEMSLEYQSFPLLLRSTPSKWIHRTTIFFPLHWSTLTTHSNKLPFS